MAWQRWSGLRGPAEVRHGITLSGNRESAPDVSDQPSGHGKTAPRNTRSRPVPVQSSWQNPFDAELWDHTGCTFQEDRLQLKPAGVATFLRPYRRLRVEFTVASGLPPDSEAHSAVRFELHLINPDEETGTVVTVTGNEVSLAHQSGLTRRQVRAAPWVSAPGSHETDTYRITATGSRILIWRENQMLLNCPQAPSDAAGLSVRFIAGGHDLMLSDMRFEGE